MTECAFDGCTRAAQAKGLCGSHHRQRWYGRELAPLRTYKKVVKTEAGRECTKCEQFKPWSEFYARMAECKECFKARRRNYA